jgi:hypothetical protein
MEITSHTKLLDLLNEYPDLEEKISAIAPPFKNLRNPILRRTVGQLATIEKVAEIGGMETVELINTLRRAVGQEEIRAETKQTVTVPARSENDPEWIAGEPQFMVNGIEMLRQGDVPLQHINELLGQLSPTGFILLLTDFEPSPMLDAMRKQNRLIFHKPHPEHPGQYLTFIQ